MKSWKPALAAAALAFASCTSAMAARTDLVLGVPLEPPHLDPTAGAAAAIDEVLYANVFEGLTRIGSGGEVLPALAESWTVSEDGKTYTFKLHTGVKFHDGTDFDAEDVKFSLDRARGETSTNAQKGLFAAIDTVEVVDPATVKVTLKNPQGSFLYNMGWGDAVIVAPESADTNKEKPIGTGPFKFDNWAKGSSITLVKSADYWGEPAMLDKAEFRIIPDAAAAVPALLSGDVQALPNFQLGDALPQVQSDPRFKVVIGATEGETILSTNNKKPPFDQLKVRQAIAHALDRKAIIDGASGGFGVPIGSHFSPANAAYIDLTGTYPYDPAKSKELLKEAGFRERHQGDAEAAAGRLRPRRRPDHRLAAARCRHRSRDHPGRMGRLAEAGLHREGLRPVDRLAYRTQRHRHLCPQGLLLQLRQSGLRQGDGRTQPHLRRGQAHRALQAGPEILADDAVNGFLFELPKIGIWDAKVEGLWENSPIQANDLTKVKWVD